MNMDKMINSSFHYLLMRDILLLLLMVTHMIITYQLIDKLQHMLLLADGFAFLIWLGYYMKSLRMYFKARKDQYLKQAIKDEYIKEIIHKSSYHGYAAMFIACSVFILMSLVTPLLSITLAIPYYIVVEIILLIGIVTGDISKVIQARD